MRSMKLLAPLLITLVACGGKPDAPTTPAAAEDEPAASDPALAACTAMLTRARGCDGYLPALVDMRIELDQPGGIAARAAEPGGRDALLAEAQTEWATDSTDANIQVSCTRLVADVPPEAVTEAERCNATASCDEFVPCSIALMRGVHGGR
jgi:hypothetical protein